MRDREEEGEITEITELPVKKNKEKEKKTLGSGMTTEEARNVLG